MVQWDNRIGNSVSSNVYQAYIEDDQTQSFRGSKSRNKVSVGEPAEGSLPSLQLPNPCEHYLYVASAEPPRRPEPPAVPRPGTKAPAGGHKLFCFYSFFWVCRKAVYKWIKTFNNGSLGSGIDEERSEMR